MLSGGGGCPDRTVVRGRGIMAPRATALDAGARGHPLGEVRGVSFRNLARRFSNQEQYRSLHWVGSFEDYLNIVHQRPEVTRNAFQRVYDMVMSWGSDETTRYKRALTRYKFFQDPIEHG